MKYSDYLQTNHWRQKKRALFKLRRGTCQLCHFHSSRMGLFDGHHKNGNYTVLWHEDVRHDLLLLCNEWVNGCHYRRHRLEKGYRFIKPSDVFFFCKLVWTY